MVVLHEHVERFADLEAEHWREASALAHRAASSLEARLSPKRCYVASLGTDLTDLPMTCPHLHLHVIPVFESGARPAQVLSWADGVGDADEAWWQAELAQCRAAWASTASSTSASDPPLEHHAGGGGGDVQ